MVYTDTIKNFDVYCYVIRLCLEQGTLNSKEKMQSKLASLKVEIKRLYDDGISPAKAIVQLERKIDA